MAKVLHISKLECSLEKKKQKMITAGLNFMDKLDKLEKKHNKETKQVQLPIFIGKVSASTNIL
jgi:hypothetical protein